ncbi:F-box domain-containing protein [Pleurotus pulmonarius]
MVTVFLELLTLAFSMTTEFLRLVRWDWSHSILLQHLRLILWQPPKTLNDVPYDVAFVLSHYLSVQDLCNLRATSKRLFNLLQDRSIWLLVLRDILEVRPIPRLCLCLDEMNLDEIMTTTLRLTTLDRKIRGIDPITTFTTIRSLNVIGIFPVPLPGGRHFATLQDSGRKLVAHRWSADTLEEGRPLVPPSKHSIYFWRAVPVSSTAINVAVVSLEELDERDVLDRPLLLSHISIYRCDADEGTSEQIDYFSVDPKICALSFDTTHLAILWDDPDDGQYAYIRLYTKGLHTSIMRLKDPQCPRGGSITMISEHYFIVVNAGGTFHRMFTLPNVYPVASTHVADVPTYRPSIWRTIQGGDCLRTPRVTSIQFEHRPSSSDRPPSQFIIWTGRFRCISTLSLPDHADVAYDVDSQHMWPDVPYSKGRDDVSVLGRFSGVHYLPDRLIRLFALPVTHTMSRGLMRLDAAPSSHHIQVTRLVCSGLVDSEFVHHLSYDEESGRLYITYKDRTSPNGRIVLACL